MGLEKRLEAAAGKLNQVSDAACAAVKRVETWLLANSVGGPASVEGDDGYTLVYARCGSKFRVAVVTGDRDMTPWNDCPRDVKLATFPLLPKLLRAIVDAVEKQVATTKAESVIAEINGLIGNSD